MTLLPEKSKKKYQSVYQSFMDWRSQKNYNSFSENVLLVYFRELSEKYKSSSLWSQYSMIKSTLNLNNNIDIEKYLRLRTFLKRKAAGYRPKKANIFSPQEIKKFIHEAPDRKYLAAKVALIMGVLGGFRTNEMHSLNIDDLQDIGSAFLVTLPNSKSKSRRIFTITNQFYEIVKKYIDLRPDHVTFNSFFLNYQNGKCTVQRIGINKFGAMGKKIATFLGLSNAERYTGHSFRRSSATLLVDSEGDITALKRRGGWKSATVVENSIDNSIQNEIQTSEQLSESTNNENKEKSESDIQDTAINILPEKSKKKYQSVYQLFMDWRNQKNVDSYSEDVVLLYFRELSEKYKSSSLWSQYSMLKSTLNLNNNIDIDKYLRLRAFLKRKSAGYRPEKASIFSPQEVKKFIHEAPDHKYLATKVALIMGVLGACRAHEMYAMNIADLQNIGSAFLVTIPNTTTKVSRKFMITNRFYQIVKKYMDLRPGHVTFKSFFINYQNGKCTIQRIGINKFGAMGKKIATFLGLSNPQKYTGHSFPRSSAALLLEAGEDLAAPKRDKAWKSTTVVEDCINKQDEEQLSTSTSNPNQDIIESINCDLPDATLNLLPEKSKKIYQSAYQSFMDWRNLKNVDMYSEDVMLLYFQELSEKYKSSSLWSQYSMLKSTLNLNNNINIEKYPSLQDFLKQKSEGYQPKKANIFSPQEINKFINEAPDYKYLETKVALIMGIFGACRANEMHSLNVDDLQDIGSAFLVTIPNCETKVSRIFTIPSQYYHIVKKYLDLRPDHVTCNTFFLNYQNGKCTIQRIGINKFGAMGKKIATFLGLANPETYTGHSFRRSSATLLVDAGGDLTALKRHGGWKSTTVAEGYIDNSVQNKIHTAERLSQLQYTAMNLLPEKSKKKYQSVYQSFVDWRNLKNVNSYSEDTLLLYFQELSEKYKSSSLWSQYSMLKSTLNLNDNIDIDKYLELRDFLKRKSEGYQPKKATIFSPQEINKFINEAPDQKYLATKVALIMGVVGACRANEMRSMNIDDLQDMGSAFLVTIPIAKTRVYRKFTITNQFYDIVKKYMDLRPDHVTFNSFFVNYQNGKCTSQKIGINKFTAMGKKIATYLGLSNPERYTGHSFRRSSATLLVDAEGDITALKRHGGWKSTTVVEGYIDNFIKNKMHTAEQLSQSINNTNRTTTEALTDLN